MTTRGRGGAGGGRGRGRASLSFNVEQLGLAPGEVLPGPVLQPPPLYPPLDFRPSPLLNSASYQQKLLFKSRFLDYFSSSNAYIRYKPVQSEEEKLISAEQPKVNTKPFSNHWALVPSELKPNFIKRKRKLTNSLHRPGKVERKNLNNLNSWLEELEKKEAGEESKERGNEEKDKKKSDEEQELENDEMEEDDLDEEMDDGTDYNQNYFDNGEGYLDDEDDNLDDGPVY